MLGWFDEHRIKELLNIPEKIRIGLLITLGYSDEQKRKKVRKSKEKMGTFNGY